MQGCDLAREPPEGGSLQTQPHHAHAEPDSRDMAWAVSDTALRNTSGALELPPGWKRLFKGGTKSNATAAASRAVIVKPTLSGFSTC